ncbi:toxin-activating lysine-acyltransferase [Klebsiella michiganensis]|uniref:toxin-activating lysine-acyltransferase n=1 Tax=Klebsiella michiganensis TaxID=1134687 RepID=UPI001CCE259D|nr:toxin-activating lysine-acyltransferase [Klebsiella michiganensis]MBZ7451592.1 toxin-activating lysine-acyltransferase [Klebsiella michiganensis]
MEHFDIYRKLGNAFELLAYSELHKDYSVEYLYREIYLPASLKQMYVYYDEDELPVGFITWASINSIVEGNIENNYTGLSIKEWNCGERLFINDLVCPWGGSRFIVNDIKNRLFPLVKYGLGLRRKKDSPPRLARFFTNKTNASIIQILFPEIGNFLQHYSDLEFDKILSEMEYIKSSYELSYLLDKNDDYNKTALNQVNEDSRAILNAIYDGFEFTSPLTHYQKLFINNLHLFIKGNQNIKSPIEQYLINVISSLPTPVVKNKDPIQHTLFLGLTELLCLFTDFLLEFFPFIEPVFISSVEYIDFDTTTTPDKIEKPFCLIRGPRGKVYIYCTLPDDNSGIMNLLHEITHALFYLTNTQKNNYGFINWQRSVLINETVAFVFEYLFLSYLKKHKLSVYTPCKIVICAHDKYYFESQESSEHHSTCSSARKLAWHISQHYEYLKDDLDNFIYLLFEKGLSLQLEEIKSYLYLLQLQASHQRK